MEWDKAWGDPADYNIVADRSELEGFHVGDHCEVLEDTEEGLYAGDEVTIVGISHTEGGLMAETRDELIVHHEELAEPVGVSPDDLARI